MTSLIKIFSRTGLYNAASMFGFILLAAIGITSCKMQKESSASADGGMDLYLLIGQSNMAGRAPIGVAERDSLDDVLLFTGTGWVPAANPLNKYSTVRKVLSMQKLGPGYSFARKIQSCTGRKIGLVVNARGGTMIEWWEKGYAGANDFDLYENAISQAKEAMKYGKLRAIIWHQGEGNQTNPDQYMPLLKKLVKDLRKDLGTNLFFVAGEVSHWRTVRNRINGIIRTIPQKLENADYVNSNGLTPLEGDTMNPHFDTQSQIVLGERYADKVLEKIYGLKHCN